MVMKPAYSKDIISEESSIPIRNIIYIFMTFNDLRKGQKAVIIYADNSTLQSHRLQEMGLTKDTEFTVTKVATLGDPIEIELRGYRLCLRRKEAEGFILKEIL